MYGLPGTGKTMIAKAIAREIQAKFFSVKSSDIVSKWFGEAEKNVRNLFETARKESNAVIFFDEFEALGAKRSSNSSVMSRLIPELLAQIQGFNETDANIMILAATNRPWDLDSAFLRPGRFDEKLYVPLPDNDARKFIITKALEGLPLDNNIEIEKLVAYTDGFNAADVVEFCERLKDGPIRRTIENGGKNIENINLDDVNFVRNNVKSSVNPQDITALQKWKTEFAKN
jgi:transitional endoplasmic reticulum ATPase